MDMLKVEVSETPVGEMVTVTVVHFAKRQYLKEGGGEEVSGNGAGNGNGHRKPSDDPERVKERVARHRSNEDVTPPALDVTPLVTPPASRAYAGAGALTAEAEADPFALQKAEAEAEAPLPPNEATADSVPAPAPPAPPLLSKTDPAPALPIRVDGESPPLLSKYDEQELQKSGWTLIEIDYGVAILQERLAAGKRIDNPKGVLHKSVLPDVRAGKRPKSQQAMPMVGAVPGGRQPAEQTKFKLPEAKEADAFGVTDAASMKRFVQQRLSGPQEGESAHGTG